MKKILFILLCSCLFTTTHIQAEGDGFGTVGIDKIEVSSLSPSSVKITATFFNLSDMDIPVHLEASVTDSYSKIQFKNINQLTSDVLDTKLSIPGKTNSYVKEYTYTIPNIPKKDSYKIELRVFDDHENMLYERQSNSVMLGSSSAIDTGYISTTSWFQYDGKKYDLQDGPIVEDSKKDSAFYSVEIHNTSTSSLVVYVDYSTRKYTLETSVFVKNTDSSVKVEIPKKSKKIIQVPVKYIPEGGTYEGKIDISTQDNGETVALKSEEFRYMIGSSFVIVTDALLGTSTVTLAVSNTLFDTNIELSEEYLTSTTSRQTIESYKDKKYTFNIDFLDNTETVIGTQSSQIAWGDIGTATQIPITAVGFKHADVAHIRVTVKDFSDITLYTGSFDIFTPAAATGFMTLNQKTIALITLSVLILLAIIGYGINRHKLWLVCMFICAVLFAYVGYTKVSATAGIDSGNFIMSAFSNGGIDAGSHSLCSAHGYQGLNMNPISYPSPSDTFTCGQTVAISMRPVNSVCGNNTSNTYFYVSGLHGATIQDRFGGNVAVGQYVLVHRKGVAIYPLTVTFDNGYTGTATVTGHYKNINGACSSTAGEVTFTFNNITCNQSCACNGRDKVCTSNGITSTTTQATECRLGVACGTSVSGTEGTFTYTVSNGLGNITYTGSDDRSVISNPNTQQVAVGDSISQSIIVRDSFDDSTAYSSCVIRNDGTGGNGNNTNTDTSTTSTSSSRSPSIISFRAASPVVHKNTDCVYDWNVQDVDQCSLTVNNTSVLLQGNDLQGPVSVSTANGLNQRATITCIANATPALATTPPTPAQLQVTISTSTLCQVLPETVER